MVTFHPAGFTHGPHPKAFAAGQAYAKKFTDEVAVMLDTRDALQVSSLCEGIENPRYVSSWQRPDAAASK
jgi:homogentisate 1,2-dioxygenase